MLYLETTFFSVGRGGGSSCTFYSREQRHSTLNYRSSLYTCESSHCSPIHGVELIVHDSFITKAQSFLHKPGGTSSPTIKTTCQKTFTAPQPSCSQISDLEENFKQINLLSTNKSISLQFLMFSSQ